MNDTRSNLDYRNNNNVKREKDNLISNSFQCLSWNKFRLSVASSNRHRSVEKPSDLQQTKVFIFWMISKCSLWETLVLCKDRWDQSAHNIFLLFSILSFRIFSPLSVSFFLGLFVYLVFGRLLFILNAFVQFAPFFWTLRIQIIAMHCDIWFN